ncbi:MAG: hypothetical protein V9E89_00050 [Ilumatobacteraceae bacterium]
MGQQVAITTLPSRPGELRFEANRNFTGMGHERFRAGDEIVGTKPSALVARKLIGTGHVDGVHVYGNIINIQLARGVTGDGLVDVVRDMYQYWIPGRELPTFDDTAAADTGASGSPAAAADGAGGGVASAYEQRVPENLRQRSASALARWKANH